MRPAEIILEGASETGKTYAALQFLDSLARKYPRARMAIVRQYHIDLDSTVLDIYKREFVEPAGDIRKFGGENVVFYEYQNGTRIWTAGMDRPGKVLSGGLDAVYFNQAEESKAEGWETLSTRTTGRAGVIVPGILFGDMNPGPPLHWIYSREAAGKTLILQTSHRDNPKLFDANGVTTEQGKETLSRLSNLTGTLRSRLFEGKRVSATGLIYGDVWDENNGSVTEAAEYEPNAGPVVWACDDGYSAGSAPHTRGIDPITGFYVGDAHPRVILFCQLKPDGHIDVFDESYACLKLSNEHISEALLRGYPEPDFAAHGPGAAEIRGRFYEAGITPRQCTAKVDESIKELRGALAADANGWRRVRVHPRCRNLRAEMAAYVYEPGSEAPVKQFDHGCLIAGTLIETRRGQIPIEHVLIGDEVMTRNGYRCVTDSQMTDKSAMVMEVVFSNGVMIQGTPDHPVFVDGIGFLPIDALRNGDRIVVSQSEVLPCPISRAQELLNQNPCFSMELNSGVTPMQKNGRIESTLGQVVRMLKKACDHIITNCIKVSTEKSPLAFMFTTRITTPSTIQSIILRQSVDMNIKGNTDQRQNLKNTKQDNSKTSTRLGRSLRNGTLQQRGEHGTLNTEKNRGSGANLLLSSALIAEKNIRRLYPTALNFVEIVAARSIGTKLERIKSKKPARVVEKNLLQPIGELDIAQLVVRQVNAVETRKAVYNLTIDGAHEYFANGVLVHNCDSIRGLVWLQRWER